MVALYRYSSEKNSHNLDFKKFNSSFIFSNLDNNDIVASSESLTFSCFLAPEIVSPFSLTR